MLVRSAQGLLRFQPGQSRTARTSGSLDDGQAAGLPDRGVGRGRGTASIWVRIPKIKGNARQEIKLHWGKADAASESNGKAVFNESNGYLSVWHMNEPVKDEVGTLASPRTPARPPRRASSARPRHFAGKKGIFCGDKIPNYPSGASSHSTEAWFRAEKPNATIIGWGNEGGGRGSKVRMQLRSPPHIHIDSDFSDVNGESTLPLGEWVHVVHTYDRGEGKIYINGRLDASAKPLLAIKSPARLWIGGWYHNYDFVGDIDEVRISKVARSADWVEAAVRKPEAAANAGRAGGAAGQRILRFAGRKSRCRRARARRSPPRPAGRRRSTGSSKRDGRETVVADGPVRVHLRRGPGGRRPVAHAAVQGDLCRRGEDQGHPRHDQGGHSRAGLHAASAGRRGTGARRSRSCREIANLERDARPRARAS